MKRTPSGAQPRQHDGNLSFSEATDVTDLMHRRWKLRLQLIAMRFLVVLLALSAVCVAGYPYVMQWISDRRLASESSTTESRVAGWPYSRAEEAVKAAKAYNRRLASSGQPILGEAVDPFSTTSGASRADGGKVDSKASQDAEYQSLLDASDGVMGAIRIPQLSIDLPIYHGTGERSLARGAGHLYGTSLPVGGASTHSVITGHRGLVEALMFTRLDEMHKGDFFYLDVMGETLAYQVDHIWVIDPDDTSRLRITPGEDRVTLLTCTPYGVNTQRLLVSGVRVTMPDPAPDPTDVRDARTIGLWAGAGALAVGLMVLAMKRLRRESLDIRARHVSEMFWRGGRYGR